MNSDPKVSVVMSVFNGSEYLRAAIESVLAQSFSNFEFIIINDGSDEETTEILKSYKDKRIRILSQKNKGLVASLNRGVSEARGKYIARQDADDISEPNRFEKQIGFLDIHKGVVLLGTSISVMNAAGKITHSHHVLLHDPELRQELLVRSPFAHGSVMFNRTLAKKAGEYNQSFWPAEDYELWLRLSAYGEMANLDECLYIYREHDQGISASNKAKQNEIVKSIQELAWIERERLVVHRRISLSDYKDRDDAKARIDRIIKNVSNTSKKARKKDVVFALRTMSLISRSPLAYRRLAGSFKRKVKR